MIHCCTSMTIIRPPFGDLLVISSLLQWANGLSLLRQSRLLRWHRTSKHRTSNKEVVCSAADLCCSGVVCNTCGLLYDP